MKKILAIFSLVILLVSCTKEITNNTDNPLINNINSMADFLFDIHISESLEKERFITYPQGQILYTKIFEKHGVTPEQFDSAISYYTVHNKDYKKVYEKVTDKINKYIKYSEQDFFNKYPKENIDVWKDYAIFPDSLKKMTQFLPFYICPKPEYLNKPLIIEK
jgi:hypothetical protein